MLDKIIGFLPYWVASVVNTYLTFINCAHTKKPVWKIGIVLIGKFVLINILFQVVLRTWYKDSLFFAVADLLGSAAWFAVMIFWVKSISTDPVERSLLLVIFSDFLVTLGIVAVSFVTGKVFGTGTDAATQTAGIHTAFAAAMLAVYLGLLWGIFGKWLKKIKKMQLRYPRLAWVCVAVFQIMGMVAVVVADISNFVLVGISMNTMYIMGAAMIVMVVMGVLLYQHLEQKHLYREVQSLLVQKQLMEEYNTSLQMQIETTRKLRHDIANHIQTLETLTELCGNRPEFSDYVTALQAQYRMLTQVVYCSNIIINAVLCNKVNVCRGQGIDVSVEIRSMEMGEVTEMELLSILYNLFDNAIEGCRKVDKTKDRFIRFICDNTASQLVMKMKNSADQVIQDRSGRLLTAKRNRKLHGMGMGIVEDIVKSHNGVLKYQLEQGVFEIMAVLETEGEKNADRDM